MEKNGQNSRRFFFTQQKEGEDDVEIECVTEDEVVKAWLALFESFQSTIVLGYSVAEQLAGLLASTVGEARSKVDTTVIFTTIPIIIIIIVTTTTTIIIIEGGEHRQCSRRPPLASPLARQADQPEQDAEGGGLGSGGFLLEKY